MQWTAISAFTAGHLQAEGRAYEKRSNNGDRRSMSEQRETSLQQESEKRNAAVAQLFHVVTNRWLPFVSAADAAASLPVASPLCRLCQCPRSLVSLASLPQTNKHTQHQHARTHTNACRHTKVTENSGSGAGELPVKTCDQLTQSHPELALLNVHWIA